MAYYHMDISMEGPPNQSKSSILMAFSCIFMHFHGFSWIFMDTHHPAIGVPFEETSIFTEKPTALGVQIFHQLLM
jgi:hypothetical protein